MAIADDLLRGFVLLEIVMAGGVVGSASFAKFALTNHSHILMFDAGKNTTNATNYGSGVHAITFFEAAGDWKYVCWTEDKGKRSGNEFICLTPAGNISWTSFDGVGGMKIDSLAGNVYWASTKGLDWQIQVTNLVNGVEGYLLAGKDNHVTGLVVDERAGFMAWMLQLQKAANNGPAPPGRMLERSSMDGSSRRVALPITHGTLTHDIAIDPVRREIFLFADSAIVKVGYNGTEFDLIFPFVFHNFLSSLMYKEDYLYYFVRNNEGMRVWELTNNSTTKLPNITLPFEATGISLPALAINATNPCANGNCSSLCYLSEIAPYYKCGCGPAFELVPPGNKECRLLDNFLVYATERSIYRKIIYDNGSFSPAFTLGFDYAHALSNLAYGEKIVYWTSQTDKKICSESIAGGKGKDVVTDQISRTSGLAVDGIGGNLFWTDSETYRIEVLNVNPGKTFRKVLVATDVNVPHGLTVDAGAGLMFWSDVSNSQGMRGNETVGRIERIALDGSQRTTIMDKMEIVTTDLIAKDGFLYWWKRKGIYRCKYDGSGTEFVAKFLVETRGGMGYSLGFHDDHVYWIDAVNLTLLRQELNSTVIEPVLPKMERPNLRAFLFVLPDSNDTRNPCKSQRATCQHFCLFNGDVSQEWHCSCEEDFVLESDGTTCTRTEEYNRKILIRTIVIIGLVGLCLGGVLAFGGTRYYLANRRVMSEEEYQNFLKGKQFLESVVGYEAALGEPLPDEHIIALSDIEVTKEKIGSGHFGVVYRGRLKGQPVAVKTLKDTHDDGAPVSSGTRKSKCAVLLAEIKIMSHLQFRSHPNVVQFHGVELTRVKYGQLLMVTELAETNLESFLNTHSNILMECIEKREVSRMMQWCAQVAGAMVHLGELKIVHEDLAVRNILLFENASIAKVGDFGLARQLGNSRYVQLESSAKLPWQQLAPESWLHKKFSPASDVWAFGLLVWMIFSPGSDPFPRATFPVDPADEEEKRRIWRGLFSTAEVSMMENIQNPLYEDVELSELLYECLKVEPMGRPSFEAILGFFHPQATSAPVNTSGCEYVEMDAL